MTDTRKKRKPFERARVVDETARLFVQGWPQWRIAEHMGVSIQQVKYDLAIAKKQWRASSSDSIQMHKDRELTKLDELERVYWEAWLKSLDEKTETTVHEIVNAFRDEDGEQEELIKRNTRVKRIQKEGNPAYLAGVERCVEQRRAILGLDAPKRTAITDTEGRDVLPLEQLRSMFLKSEEHADAEAEDDAPPPDEEEDEDE